PWRSVLDNVLFSVEMLGLEPRQYRKQALDLLELTGLSGSEPPADGRALRRARRDDARGDEPGATPHLGGATQDDSVRHAFHPRGDPAGRPRGSDDAAARPRRAHPRRAPAAPAHDRNGVRSAVQG